MNTMPHFKKLPAFFLFLTAAVLLFPAGFASAGAKPQSDESLLFDTYQRNRAKLETSSFGFPLVVESSEREDRVHVDVYGIFEHPFNTIVDVLTVPTSWCDIAPLHPNVKGCTYSKLPVDWLLTFYLGSRAYQPLEDTRSVIFHYRSVDRQGNLDIVLNAAEGPYGTKEHRIRFEALPITGGRTFVHVSYAYSDSVALRFVAKIYFATLGRSKVGFTVTGTDESGNPIYIGGPRGAVERSAVRYFFAIQSFMNTLRYPEESRFSMRINEWYDLTARYRKQLFDLDRKDYLAAKTKEHENQVTLQRRIATGVQ
ncbi:DUF3421 domain-containing protein [Oryzomonas rubra]|uniref:Uncharacterized protein n=1 Tax=Oryzomonas rubra TaxID=2509454 RepID=A0A5A9XBS9_9BACT|nr:DUF3421 domain-containing protein [Oryzomonas rubra]KAA0890370.1 hypothetical protein ET418_11930 [Oryzomonas rubra]